MAKREEKGMLLRVAEAKPSDVGRGLARMDPKVQRQLGLSAGDIVEILGKKSTAALVWPGYREDEGTGVIRIDGLTRQNAGTSIGDVVRVRRAEAKAAVKVVLAPSMEIRFDEAFADYVKRQLLGRPIVRGDIVPVPALGTRLDFTVTSTQPSGIVIVGDASQVEVLTKPSPVGVVPLVTYEDIGDMKEAIERVREMVELPLKHPELFRHLGIEPPKGVLLYGPPGCGKTLLAKALANEAGAAFFAINGPEIMSKYYGESEARLREIFEEAEKNAPAIIFIDEIDAIAPKREEVTGEVERRVVAQLLTLMDGLKGRGNVVVIGATNRPDALDPALRRPGRFDREIRIGVPDKQGRKEILQVHTRNMPLADDVDLNELAELTHGFVGADLAALAREAAMHALRRVMPTIDLTKGTIPSEVLERIKVTREDFLEVLKGIQPSALREVYVEVPEVRWDDVGGLEDVKRKLREVVEWPLRNPELFERLGIKPARGVLLFGPPGTGKTLLAKAVATESNANFIAVRGPEVLSKWVGESEKAIREIFRKARQTAPCVIFFDELDSIAPTRGSRLGDSGVTERIVNQLLSEMDGIVVTRGVVVIGATNRPDIIDPGLLRPGRFDHLIYVPPPDKEARLQIFKVHTRKMPLAKDVDLEKLAEMTEFYTGADIEAVCREAALNAAREDPNAREVAMKHFLEALKAIPPSLSEEDIKFYEDVAKRLKKVVR